MELQSKFIEGTNEQYSIRNDGVIVQHFKYTWKGNIASKKDSVLRIYNTGYCVLMLNKERVSTSIRPLLDKYFSFHFCYKCQNKIHSNNVSDTCDNCKQISKESVIFSRAYIARISRIKVADLDEDLYQAIKTRVIIKRKLKQIQNG